MAQSLLVAVVPIAEEQLHWQTALSLRQLDYVEVGVVLGYCQPTRFALAAGVQFRRVPSLAQQGLGQFQGERTLSYPARSQKQVAGSQPTVLQALPKPLDGAVVS